MAKMDSVNDKCTGVKKIDWTDSLKGKTENSSDDYELS